MRCDRRCEDNLFKNVDPEVKKSTRFIALVVLIGSLLMQAVFLVIGQWDVTVLWGNLLGAAASLLNFYLMALAVVKALGMEKENAVKHMRGSQGMRMVMLFGFCALGAAVDCFNLIAVVVPLIMPSIGAKIRGMLVRDDPNNPPHSLLDEDEEEGLD